MGVCHIVDPKKPAFPALPTSHSPLLTSGLGLGLALTREFRASRTGPGPGLSPKRPGAPALCSWEPGAVQLPSQELLPKESASGKGEKPSPAAAPGPQAHRDHRPGRLKAFAPSPAHGTGRNHHKTMKGCSPLGSGWFSTAIGKKRSSLGQGTYRKLKSLGQRLNLTAVVVRPGPVRAPTG